MTTPINETFNAALGTLCGRLILQSPPALVRSTVVNAFKERINLKHPFFRAAGGIQTHRHRRIDFLCTDLGKSAQ